MAHKNGLLLALALFALLISSPFAAAAVSAEAASKLKSTLTPFGAERAGNSTGTIPPWDGGYTQVWPGYRSGQPRPDPFATEKPLLQITGQNIGAHADKLSDGIKALLERYPTLRLDVYPTHRTAAAPPWVYDNTFQNATRAITTHAGISIQDAYGGIPFPIPKTGPEAMWNHLLAWRGESSGYDYNTYLVTGGKPVLTSGGRIDSLYPYYDKNGDLKTFNNTFFMVKAVTTDPPIRVGDDILVHDPINQANERRKAWQYITGQRRVRRAPTIAYDTPTSFDSGFSVYDEGYLFNGALDRYDWKLLGKREIFIPYNAHRFHGATSAAALNPHHLNPDHVRWELHRVWVVEATLAAGKRHIMPKRRFYLDEDTWLAMLADGWDAKGELWHTAHALPIIVPELPAVVTFPLVIYDLAKGGYAAHNLFNDEQRHYQIVPHRADGFSPAALMSEGIR